MTTSIALAQHGTKNWMLEGLLQIQKFVGLEKLLFRLEWPILPKRDRRKTNPKSSKEIDEVKQ